MDRECYGPSLLWAEMSRNPLNNNRKNIMLNGSFYSRIKVMVNLYCIVMFIIPYSDTAHLYAELDESGA